MGMVELSVEIDFTFIERILAYLENREGHAIPKIIEHEAARGVHTHASRFRNTDKDLLDFWVDKLNRESDKGDRQTEQIRRCAEYIRSNVADFRRASEEIAAFLPADLRLSCKLYPIVGYDIGIVSEGNAFLNLGHPLFHEHERELLYIAMHELHHVGYSHYNPIYSLDELETTRDLLRIVKHSTHLEGLAVYAPFGRRRRENGFAHRDYAVLNDRRRRSKATSEFLGIVEEFENEAERPLNEDDLRVLNRMSDGDRLWYVGGAHMAQAIDRRLGREALNRTIVEGPDSFFAAYEKSMA